MILKAVLRSALQALPFGLCLVASVAYGCNPKCPTCQAAVAHVNHDIAILNAISQPVIGPAYVCHDPNWAQQDPAVGRWQSAIDSISQQTMNGIVPPLFTAAEMFKESGGNPNAIGAPVPNRALGLMQTLPPAEEEDAQVFGEVKGYNGNIPTAWPRTPPNTPLPPALYGLRMGIQEQAACIKLFLYGNADPAALPVCYSKSIALAQEVMAAHNNYKLVLAGHPATESYVTGFLNFAHCTPIAPTASTPYRKYP